MGLMRRHVLKSAESLVELLPIIGRQGYPVTLSWVLGDKRSLSQNALIHMWFGEIAKQTNESADQVKRECKFYQGCPILMAESPEFVAFVKNLEHLTTEQKIASMDFVSVTSVMTTAQLKRMCDAVQRKYLSQGIRLTDPELIKYEGAA